MNSQLWCLNVSVAHVLFPPERPKSSLPVLHFHRNVIGEEFAFCICRDQHFRVAILSHFKRKRLIKLDQTYPVSTPKRQKSAKTTQFGATSSTIIPLGNSSLFNLMLPSSGRRLVIFFFLR